MVTMQHKILFAFVSSIKTESATGVQRAFRLHFNIQPPIKCNLHHICH